MKFVPLKKLLLVEEVELQQVSKLVVPKKDFRTYVVLATGPEVAFVRTGYYIISSGEAMKCDFGQASVLLVDERDVIGYLESSVR